MMKGISFDDIHSFEDLNLVLSDVNIPPATAKTNFVDIPGGNGSVDLTEALGEVKFNDRECTFTFTVFPWDNFEEKKREVSNLLNGKRCKITLDKDPDFYWDGRCAVSEYESDRNIHKIVVVAIVAPYKLKPEKTKVIFPAGNGVVRTLLNGRKTVVPTITNTADAIIFFNGTQYDVSAGIHKILNIALTEGKNEVTVYSTEEVQFVYQEGDL